MKTSPRALIFDLNGTMINDMEFHMRAWTEILNTNLKAGLNPEQVKRQMYGKNEELLVRVFGEGKLSGEEMDFWSMEKEKKYQAAYRPHIRLIPGLEDLLQKAFTKGIPMGIGSAAIPFNIDFILDQLDIRKYFSAG
jgi:beta-phosphoglucomutase